MIEALRVREEELRRELAEVIDKKRKLIIEKFTSDTRVDVGVIVVDSSGDEYKITQMSCPNGFVHLKGVMRKKSGEWGALERAVYGKIALKQ
jgi:F420-0:gamma-glutamyl ligase